MSIVADPAALPPLEIVGRADALRSRLERSGCEALIVTKLENVRYLSGFSGSAGTLVVTPDALLLTTDGRYRTQAEEQLAAAGVEAEIVIGRPDAQIEAIGKRCSAAARVGLESTDVSWATERRFADAMDGALVATRGLVEELRVVKDPGELARIEKACEIADIALAQVKERLLERPTENEFAAELEFEMRRRGAQGTAFETIVASGANSAMPHARPTDREIAPGDLVVIDFGARFDGYRSDMTRTLSIGEPSEEDRALIEAVFSAQRAGVFAVAPGVTGAQIDEAARSSLEGDGFGDAFLHSTGHGVGLEIHEAPAVAPGATDILAAGTIVTVEPGAYLAGRAGVRIEDTVVVTENGCRTLTKSTKDYIL